MACEFVDNGFGKFTIMCGRASKRAAKPKPCPFCRSRNDGVIHSATLLCDADIGHGKTCDAPICTADATEIGPDRHLCPIHAKERAKPCQRCNEAPAAPGHEPFCAKCHAAVQERVVKETKAGFEFHNGAWCDEKLSKQAHREWREECQESRELNKWP